MQISNSKDHPQELTVYICSICKSDFEDNTTIVNHMITVHKDNEHIQQLCQSTSLKSMHKKEGRRKVRIYNKVHKCDKCTYTTTYLTTLKRHRLAHDKNNKYNCPHCSFTTVQSYNLQLHVTSVHPKGNARPITALCKPVKLVGRKVPKGNVKQANYYILKL